MDTLRAIEIVSAAKQKAIVDAMAHGESDVQKFYKNSVIFITGGSGFLGKQLIEKLFRCCQISKIYLLLRNKKEKHVQTRLKEMLLEPVFDSLRQIQPNFGEKIIPIEGNVAELKLGIKYNDWMTLTKDVNIIFHMSAITKFNASLRTATILNLRGTRETLHLAKACTKLRSFVHISTAYCRATKNLIGCEVQEKFYNATIPPETLISLAENVDESILNNITADLTNGWPNTYTFTKTIAEELIRTTSDGLPICIVRPAAVLSSYCEPDLGWIDKNGIFGPSGLINGYVTGVIHAYLINMNVRPAYIPCDYVNNAIIVAAKETGLNHVKEGNDIKIYNLSSTHRNSITMSKLFAAVDTKEAEQLKKKLKIGKYTFSIKTTNRTMFKVISLLFHQMPAYLADFGRLMKKKQRKYSKLSKKIYTLSCVTSYFSLNDWDFVDDNLEQLFNKQSTQDQTIFNFDVTDIDWNEYFLIFIAGAKKYLNL